MIFFPEQIKLNYACLSVVYLCMCVLVHNGDGLLSRACCDRAGCDGFKLKDRRSRLDKRKKKKL